MSSRADLEWWWDIAPTLRWTKATTMPKWPHWYVVKGRTDGLSADDFDRAVRVTRTFGEPGKFYAVTNLYLYTRDRRLKWWTQGAPLAETIILNLAMADEVYGPQTNFDQAVLDELRLPETD